MTRKVLVIGLDGAPYPLVKKWLDRLPNLKKLSEQGAFLPLLSTIPSQSATAWTTFKTGTNPGKHGVKSFKTDDGWLSSSHGPDPFWVVLGEAGKKVGVMNIPGTYPPSPVNGFLVAAFMTPPNETKFTYPENLDLGDYKIDMLFERYSFIPSDTGIDKLDFKKELYDVTDKRYNTALKLMDEKEWDFFIVSYKGSDSVEHFFWRDMVDKDPTWGNAIFDYYAHLDKIVGGMLEKVDLKETTVFVMSDHGQDLIQSKIFHVNQLLLDKGAIKLKKSAGTKLRRIGNKLLSPLYRPEGLFSGKVKWLLSLESLIDKKASIALLDSDFSKDWDGGIHLMNLKGDRKKRTRKKLVEILRRYKDPETGKPVVKNIYNREELYNGKYASSMPDIVFQLHKDYVCNHRIQFRTIDRQKKARITGSHTLEGILFAAGNLIEPRIKKEDAVPNIVDLAPTIQHILQVPAPDYMDGRVLKELLTPEEAKKPFLTQVWPEEGTRDKFNWSKDDEELIKKRLMGLGYL